VREVVEAGHQGIPLFGDGEAWTRPLNIRFPRMRRNGCVVIDERETTGHSGLNRNRTA
jgi:hypothetical protein